MIRKNSIHGVLSVVSGIHWGSWDIRPVDKGDYAVSTMLTLLGNKKIIKHSPCSQRAYIEKFYVTYHLNNNPNKTGMKPRDEWMWVQVVEKVL